MLCKGGSYRNRDVELVTHKKNWSRLDGTFQAQTRSIKLVKQNDLLSKQFLINANEFKRLPMSRTVPVVVFEPNNLRMLTDSPDLRRSFLDDILEQSVPLFGSLRRTYKRTLAQRNALLKQAGTDDQLFVWSLRLSELGGQIALLRMRFIDKNSPLLADLYTKLVGKKTAAQLRYQTKQAESNYGSSMLGALESHKQIDRERGYTTIGPHRDDVQFIINGYPLAEAASRGETRTILLALKLLELKSLEETRGVKPMLLLDDVFSELDGRRRRALTEYLQDHQAFITTTDADIVVQHFLDNCTVIPTGQ